MIVGFADRETERLYIPGKNKRFPANIFKVSLRKLDYLNRAKMLQDLQAPPGNHLEALKGDLKGKSASGSMTSSGSYFDSAMAMHRKLK